MFSLFSEFEGVVIIKSISFSSVLLQSTTEDLFVVHFRGNIGGDWSSSNDKQFGCLDVVIDVRRRVV